MANPLENLLTTVEERMATYEKEKERAYWYWFAAQWTAILSGSAGAIVAAFVTRENYAGATKFFIVVLPALGALATTVLRNMRLYDLWRLREDGTVTLRAILNDCKQEVEMYSSEAEAKAAYKALVQRMNNVEINQVTKWFSLPLGVPLEEAPGKESSG